MNTLVQMTVRLKDDVDKKEGYECNAQLIRSFIGRNGKGLKERHYVSTFSYYTYCQMSPFEEDGIYKKGGFYNIGLKTIVEEFKDIRNYRGLETDKVELVAASVSKLYYEPKGKLKSVTPVYLKTEKIETPEYMDEVKEQVKENILFRYVTSNLNSISDLDYLRKTVIKDIRINPKFITIPFKSKKTASGGYLLYQCVHVEVEFMDNEGSKEVERVIYASGLGNLTSNGFGYME